MSSIVVSATIDGLAHFHKQLIIRARASVAEVWSILTQPEHMKKWMSEEELEIVTTWEKGSPFVIRGTTHWVPFENIGWVEKFDVERVLQYTHLSSLSRLPDRPENYARVEFTLAQVEEGTQLTLSLSHFPTVSIYKHLVFYWSVTLEVLKAYAEKKAVG